MSVRRPSAPRAIGSAVLLILLAAGTGRGQDSVLTVTGFSRKDGWPTRKVVAAGMVGAITVGTLIDSYFTWWKDAEKPFSFLRHTDENWLSGSHLGIDKPGHFFGAYAIFKSINNILQWGGVEPSTALWWAAGISFWNGFEIEIGDGFTPYGFDYQDLVFDVAGTSYGILQSQVPFLQNFNFKFSYWSKVGFTSPANFTRDYDAMTIWITAAVHRLLPEVLAPFWPDGLQLAVGYSVDDNQTRREIAIGLDLHLEHLFSAPSEDVLLAQQAVDLMHLPMPAVKCTEGKVPRYYFFHLQ